MSKLNEIVKNIRIEFGLSQKEFAEKLDVSPIYISKIETNQKEVSKKFILKLASFIDVHPAALAPFLFLKRDIKEKELTNTEQKLINLGEQLQQKLIKRRAKKHEG